MAESSRIIIKNIPKGIDEGSLKAHFEKRGGFVTDCRIMKTQEGESRQFAFIGFKSEGQARDAVEYFNNTYVQSSKVSVAYAYTQGSENIDRAWSKYSKGSSAHMKKNPQQYKKNDTITGAQKAEMEKKLKEEEEEKKAVLNNRLNEFLNVMGKKKGNKVWANEESKTLNHKQSNSAEPQVSIDLGTHRLDAQTVVPTKAGVSSTRLHVSFDDSDDDTPLAGSTEADTLSSDDEVNDIPMSDEDDFSMKPLSFQDTAAEERKKLLRQKLGGKDEESSSSDDFSASADEEEEALGDEIASLAGEEEEEEEEKEGGASVSAEQFTEECQSEMALLEDTARLCIINLSYSTTADELNDIFSRFGKVESTHVVRDEVTGKSRGIGYVKFVFPEHAIKALQKLNKTIVQGRRIEIKASDHQKKNEFEGEKKVGGTSSFKKQKEMERKKAAQDVRTWNLLYLSANNAADAITEDMGIEKADFLNGENEGVAVRVALAEAHLLKETKQWLKDEGIRVEAFERTGTSLVSADVKGDRAKDTLILKHLPPKVTDADLRGLLVKCGSYTRLCVAPSRTVALVQFSEEIRAASAFKKLAFQKFLGLPLYVEFAPVDCFVKKEEEGEEKKVEKVEKEEKEETTEKKVEESKERSIKEQENKEEEDENEESGERVSVFVKNLNFRTTDESLALLFKKVKGYLTSKISKKVAADGQKLSMGFGFIEFATKTDAKECLKKFQGVALDGHCLDLRISAKNQNQQTQQNNTGAAAQTAKIDTKKVGTRLLVKNLSFDANKRDITKLFGAYGTIASVRLPKKQDGTVRGFGFVEFASKVDAKNALEALQHAHLYGRHLVIEPALDDDNSVEAARKKTINQLEKAAGNVGTESRKRRKIQEL